MFKQILIPTDGSKLARRAIKAGIELAKALDARVVGYYATEPIERITYVEGTSVAPRTIRALEEEMEEQGRKYLAEVTKLAEAAGVPCDTAMSAAAPHQGIIDTARKKKCDAIFIASHGRGGLATLLLGSVTQKVLAHSKVPVIVYR